MATKVVQCTCRHEQQDKMYGKNGRVANETTRVSSTANKHTYRCTVCGREH